MLGVSVVICAYTQDRWDTLVAACAAVHAQRGPTDELILVVDHNPPLLARASRLLAGVRVVANTGRRGLSGARNTGVAASRGDVVAFLDDDARPRSGWLDQLRAAFGDDGVLVAGTWVEPQWEGGAPPRWFPPEFGWVVGCSYRGLPTTTAPVRNPIGASMAVRRRVFDDIGVFAETVGRVGALPVGCEETEFCVRLANENPGAVVLHEPLAVVDHAVPRQRQTMAYFLRRCFHEGRSKRAVARLGGARRGLSAERRYVRSVLPAAVSGGIGRTLRTGDLYATARSCAVLLGLTVTVVGFVRESIVPTGRR
jgi:glycosyltransferase involved in cell wall biosynthesis